jgi:hypothetical protein
MRALSVTETVESHLLGAGCGQSRGKRRSAQQDEKGLFARNINIALAIETIPCI